MKKTAQDILADIIIKQPVIDDNHIIYVQADFAIEAMQLYASQFTPVWIDVKERLPDHEKTVRAIQTFGNGSMKEIHTNYVKRTECFDNLMCEIITHWQEIELPQPPTK